MKKLMLILMCAIIALSSCVYAEEASEPVVTNEVADEAVEAEAADESAAVTDEPAEEATDDSALDAETEDPNALQLAMFLDVKLDSSARFVTRQFLDEQTYSIYKMMEQQIAEQYNEMGIETKFGEDGDLKYMEIITDIAKGDPIVFSPNPNANANYRLASVKGLFGTKYFATTAFDSRQDVLETPVEEANIYAQLTMNLPVGAKYNDASLAENGNKTLVWNIAEGRMNAITVMFTIPNIKNIAILVGIILVLLLIILFAVFGKKKTPVTDAELVEDALNHIEGEVDEFVDDPFATMTDEELETDVEDEPAEEEAEEVIDETEEVIDETEEETKDEE